MALQDNMAFKDRTVSVNFCCQRCCMPLKLHPSFRDLDSQTFSELSMPLYTNTDKQKKSNLIETLQNEYDETSVMRKIVLPLKFPEASSDFMVVDEFSNLPLDSNQTLRVTAALFDIMSDQSDVDHPVCDECCDNLLDQMDQQLKTTEDDLKEYGEYLEQYEARKDDDNLEELKLELAALQKEQSDLEQEMSRVEVKALEMKEVLKASEDEWETLQREEDKRWQEYCRIHRQLLLSEDNHRSVDNQLRYAQAQLDKLNKTNVFNATFHIWHNGHFGTINNFRLGRLPTVSVEWSEINAAWGQTVLLLHSLAKKINLQFKNYRLVPYGNHSYLEAIDGKPRELPLYCVGGLRFMIDNKFDTAMSAFLDCLQEFKEKVESGDASFHLPYAMEKGKIIDKNSKSQYSIKVQFNSEEQWTKALKFMLTNLKWALAWVSTQFQDNKSSHL